MNGARRVVLAAAAALGVTALAALAAWPPPSVRPPDPGPTASFAPPAAAGVSGAVSVAGQPDAVRAAPNVDVGRRPAASAPRAPSLALQAIAADGRAIAGAALVVWRHLRSATGEVLRRPVPLGRTAGAPPALPIPAARLREVAAGAVVEVAPDVVGGESFAVAVDAAQLRAGGVLRVPWPDVGEVAVRVVDAAGVPQPDLPIELAAAATEPHRSPRARDVEFAWRRRQLFTDADGVAVFAGVAVRTRCELRVQGASARQVVTCDGPPCRGDRRRIDVVLAPPAGHLGGVAVGAHGEPLRHTLLQLACADPGVDVRAHTDESGRFRLPLPARAGALRDVRLHELVAGGLRRRSARVADLPTVVGEQALGAVTFDAARVVANGVLSGVDVDPARLRCRVEQSADGRHWRPCPDLEVRFRGERFVVHGRPPSASALRLCAEHRDIADVAVEFGDGATDVVLPLVAACRLEVRAPATVGGLVPLLTGAAGARAMRLASRVRTDDGGWRCVWDGLAPGPYRLRWVDGRDWRERVAAVEVHVAAGPPTSLVF